MEKYWIVFRSAILDTLEYRFDFVVHTAKYAMMIIIMALVWTAVGRASGNAQLASSETVTYFFFAAILYTLSNFHPFYINDDIRLGTLSRYLVKPIVPFVYYFCWETATILLETSLKVVIFIPLFFVLQLPFSISWWQLLLFLCYGVVIIFFSYFLQATVAYLSFWLTEAAAVRWAILIIQRFLAGILMPLWLFPTWLQQISEWLPFQYLGFIPIQLMLGKLTAVAALQGLAILLGWTGIMWILERLTWRVGLHAYEAVGN